MAVREPILLTDLLTTAMDDSGCAWARLLSESPASRLIRQLRTDLDSPNLATDQMLADHVDWPVERTALLAASLSSAKDRTNSFNTLPGRR